MNLIAEKKDEMISKIIEIEIEKSKKEKLKLSEEHKKNEENSEIVISEKDLREFFISYIYDETKSLDGYRMNTSHLENETTLNLEKKVNDIEERIVYFYAADNAHERVYEAELRAAKKNDGAFIIDNEKFSSFPIRSPDFYEKEIGYKNSDDPKNVDLILKELNKKLDIKIDINITEAPVIKSPNSMEVAMGNAKKTKRSRKNKP
jgi:hypothetical protein